MTINVSTDEILIHFYCSDEECRNKYLCGKQKEFLDLRKEDGIHIAALHLVLDLINNEYHTNKWKVCKECVKSDKIVMSILAKVGKDQGNER